MSAPTPPEPTLYDRMKDKGLAWQWDGPVLRNSPAWYLDKFDWGALETIIWIATRDERSVKGALGEMADAGGRQVRWEPLHKGHLANVIIRTTLPMDVADHHTDCPRHLSSDGACCCEKLGRVRFCRCPDRLRNGPATCVCVNGAIDRFVEAFRGDLTVRGRKDGEIEFGDVQSGVRVGAALRFDSDTGLRILATFAELKIPVAEIKQRWPADFSDVPLFEASPIVNYSPQQLALQRLHNVRLPGRPNAKIRAFAILCDHLDTDTVAASRRVESEVIVKDFPDPKTEGDPKIPTAKAVAEWIGPYHEKLVATDQSEEARSVIKESLVSYINDDISRALEKLR